MDLSTRFELYSAEIPEYESYQAFCSKISDYSHLLECQERATCPKCNKSAKYFCYECDIPTIQPVPNLTLPIDVHFVKHEMESKSKSTAIQCKVLTTNTFIHNHTEIPDFDPETTLLLSPPVDGAKYIEEFENLDKIKNIVSVDSTWSQAKSVSKDSALAKLPKVAIRKYKTLFWRYQTGFDETYLATIEAMFFFLKELLEAKNGKYNHEIDDLMFYYDMMYEIIQNRYQSGKRFTQKMNRPYIEEKK
eukprot:TRINITY_DN778304_c0_g1_i1.p1 TRINITY_DN778304_c0_g1~~TRINITY_DN778304_c0_g1_i1.p1  ORF type:complete len:248 (-),score=48.25 TRINITY_DN778304_c0_g1_i1:68-811(-)